MGTPLNDETKTLFRILADEQWHRYDEVKDAIAKTIPPGRALRKYEDRLKSSRAYRQPETVKVITEDEKILYGGRACAQITISSWKDRRAVISRTEAGDKWIKMKPGFEPWKLDPSIPAPSLPKGLGEPGGSPEVPPGDSEPSTAAPAPVEPPAQPPPPEPVPVEPSSPDTPAPPPPDPAPAPEPEPAFPFQHDPPPPLPVVSISALPDCPACGLLMVDEARHERWHEDQKRAAASPEVTAIDDVTLSTLRTLLGDVMRQGLDEFQKGMQDYLDHQFSQVEARLIMLASRQRPWTQGGSRKHSP
jgi:hypothetical protein